MNKTHITLLLNVIKNKKNILQLRRERLTFKQIVELTNLASKDGLVTYIDASITLTKLGEDFLNENINLLKKVNKIDWIDADFKNKVTPFPKNDIFLPDRSEFSF